MILVARIICNVRCFKHSGFFFNKRFLKTGWTYLIIDKELKVYKLKALATIVYVGDNYFR